MSLPYSESKKNLSSKLTIVKLIENILLPSETLLISGSSKVI